MNQRIANLLGLLAMIGLAIITVSGCANAHSDYRKIHELVINGDLNGVTQDLNTFPGDIRLTDDNRQTPLHLAAIHCRTNVLVLLLEHGAKVDARAKGEVTPLHLAAQAGCLDSVSILLSHGAEINARDSAGHTPLTRAGEWGQTAVVSYLRAQGGKD